MSIPTDTTTNITSDCNCNGIIITTTTTTTVAPTETLISNIDNKNNKNNSIDDDYKKCYSLNDYQNLARTKLPKSYYEYIASGSNDEQTVNIENRFSYMAWYIQPRVCRNVSTIDMTCTIQFTKKRVCNSNNSNSSNGIDDDYKYYYPSKLRYQKFALPIFASPAGVQGIASYNRDTNNYGTTSSSSSSSSSSTCNDTSVSAELATSGACHSHDILFGLSQHSTTSIEDIVQYNNSNSTNKNNSTSIDFKFWYQAYILKDRDITIDLIERAIRAGAQGIFITVDSVRFGYREADSRNGFNSLPNQYRLINYDKYSTKLLDGIYNSKTYTSWDQNSELLFDQTITWNDIGWLKNNTLLRTVPLIIKGIMTPADAIDAITIGCADGIMISNHGGRQIDGCLNAIDVLPSIVTAVRGCSTIIRNSGSNNYSIDPTTVPILIDGGIRRGTDVLKALALGATAVGIGKPLFYALGSGGGQDAVVHMISILRTELQTVMALTGCQSLNDIIPSLVTRHPNNGIPTTTYTRSKL